MLVLLGALIVVGRDVAVKADLFEAVPDGRNGGFNFCIGETVQLQAVSRRATKIRIGCKNEECYSSGTKDAAYLGKCRAKLLGSNALQNSYADQGVETRIRAIKVSDIGYFQTRGGQPGCGHLFTGISDSAGRNIAPVCSEPFLSKKEHIGTASAAEIQDINLLAVGTRGVMPKQELDHLAMWIARPSFLVPIVPCFNFVHLSKIVDGR